MDSSVIVIDSDEDEGKVQVESSAQLKRQSTSIIDENGGSIPTKIRRIQPTKIADIEKNGTASGENSKENDPTSSKASALENDDCEDTAKDDEEEAGTSTQNLNTSQDSSEKRNEITEELKNFISACRKAESSNDMKKIIKKKLLKAYHQVHPKYATSKNFLKHLTDTTLAINQDPKRVYSRLQDVINELKSRINCQILPEEPNNDESKAGFQGTGDEKTDNKLKRLNKGLVILKKRIEDLETAEVDLDDDYDSAYMQKVRLEQRAVQIYNGICKITGESTSAHRIGKKPVSYKSSKYEEFNKKLSKKINKDNGFPSYFDVYRILDYCNKAHKYKLQNKEIDRIAQEAFEEVGKLLKERRRNDLYESALHYAGKNKDPAKEDPELRSKLEKNKEFYQKKTEEIIDLFVAKQFESPSAEVDIDNQPGTSKELKTEIDDSLPTELLSVDVKTENNNSECDTNGDVSEKPSFVDLTVP